MKTEQLTYGSLFSGIGGMDLGFDRAGFKCKWQVEINPTARKVLTKHWPDVRKHDDVRSFPPDNKFSRVDIVVGGFPCQDISVCGKGAGIEGKRSGLWGEMFRIISEFDPRFVVIENVPALAFRGLGRVLGDLSSIGLNAEWQTISAWAFGSHHKRERLYIVAYNPNTDRFRWQGRPHASSVTWSHTKFTGLVRRVLQLAVPAGKRGRISDGVSGRVEQLRGIGNAVIPIKAEWIANQIKEAANT